jgi:predicted PurR-regulated permease PerM
MFGAFLTVLIVALFVVVMAAGLLMLVVDTIATAIDRLVKWVERGGR